MINSLKKMFIIASMLAIEPNAYGMGKARGQKPTVQLSEAPALKSKKSLIAAGSVAPAATKGTLTTSEMLTEYSTIFASADLFGKPINFVNWNKAAMAIEQDGATNATKQILRYNNQLIKIIQDAHAKLNTNQADSVINKWKNDLDAINLSVFSGITATGSAKQLGQIIKNASAKARDQIKQYAQKYWKSTAQTRSRAQAGVAANPPRPIPQAMKQKPLPVPPIRAKVIKK